MANIKNPHSPGQRRAKLVSAGWQREGRPPACGATQHHGPVSPPGPLPTGSPPAPRRSPLPSRRAGFGGRSIQLHENPFPSAHTQSNLTSDFGEALCQLNAFVCSGINKLTIFRSLLATYSCKLTLVQCVVTEEDGLKTLMF